jgi:hypothetical protein
MGKRIHFLGLESRPEIIGPTVFFASAVFFSIFLLMAPDSIMTKPCSDCAGWYYPVADNLANGRGLVVGDTDRPALDRPPGQVLLLSVVFRIGKLVGVEKVTMVYGYNVLLLSLAAYLLFLTSHLFWGIKGGLISAGLWSSSPFTLWFLNQPFSEVPFFVFLFSSIWFLFRSGCQKVNLKGLFLVGMLLGMATMIRPIGFALVLPFLITFWAMRKRSLRKQLLVGSIAIISGVSATLTPWHAYLYDQKGSFVFLSDGVHMHRSVVEGFIFGIHSEEYKVEIPLTPDVKRFMEGMYKTIYRYDQDPAEMKTYGPGAPLDVGETKNVIKIATRRLSEDLILAARFLWLKISRSWYGTDSHRNESAALLLQVFYLILCGLGLIRSMQSPRTRNLALISALTTLYFWSFTVTFTPLVRYMIPALGVLFLVAPGVFSSVKTRVTEWQQTRGQVSDLS